MSTDIDYAARVERGRMYFERLRAAMAGTWHEALARYSDSDDRVLDGLVLIHPSWLDGMGDGLPDTRGVRAFGYQAEAGACRAMLVWGYPCDGTALEIDHMFPYGLGGPTRPDNGLVLCREHNRLKGHDVHLLPWESYQFPWLQEQVAKTQVRLESAGSN